MSVSFPPSFPPHTEPFGPGQKQPPTVPADILSSAPAASLESALVGLTSAPQISLATYYGKVSLAQLLQRIQEIIAALTDPLKTKELWRFTAEQAEDLKNLIINANRYMELQDQLNALNLDQQNNILNNRINAYNFAKDLDPEDQAALFDLNTAISTFNVAQQTYENALQDYQDALAQFALEQQNYQAALDAWEDALDDYNEGEIDEAALQTAQDAYNTAKGTYDDALTAFNDPDTGPQAVFDEATATYNNEKVIFNAAVSSYNAYVANRTPFDEENELNEAIADWNNLVAQAGPIISQMNDIRATVGLPPLVAPASVDPAITNYPTYSLPPTDPANPFREGTVTAINNYNTNVTTINGFITSINQLIETINTNPPSFALTPIDPEMSISPTLADILIPPDAHVIPNIANLSFTPIEQIDAIVTFVAPQVLAFDATENMNITLRRIVEDSEEAVNIFQDKQILIGGSGASVAMSVINPVEGLQSPFLERQLSRQGIESFFNFYGVPEASSLVDQIGALYDRIFNLAGLVSASPGQAILGNAAIAGPSGAAAFNAATALAFIRQLHTMASSDELTESIANLVNSNPNLAGLAPEAKASLIRDLAKEFGASLLKDGLAQVAADLGMPGLLPQILAQLAGTTVDDPLASFQQQLFQQVLLSEELSKSLNIPRPQVDEIVQQAFEQRRQDTIRFIADQIAKLGATNADLERVVRRASEDAQDRLEKEQIRVDELKKQAFRQTLERVLLENEFDPARVSAIVNQAEPISDEKELREYLTRTGVNEREANQIAQAVLKSAILQDAAYNPLGAFLLQHLGTTTELAAYFKLQTINKLTPVLGLKRSQEVAGEFSSLLFSAPNSVLSALQDNERNLRRINTFNSDARLFEDYRDAAQAYLNPSLSAESPLRLGKTLLLTGLAGGASMQGVLSSDDAVGPLANRTKHATNYPGILG